jgi:hypothetical protein
MDGKPEEINVQFNLFDHPLVKTLHIYDHPIDFMFQDSHGDQVGFRNARVGYLEVSGGVGRPTTMDVTFWGTDHVTERVSMNPLAPASGPWYVRSDVFGDNARAFSYTINNNPAKYYGFRVEPQPSFYQAIQLGRRQLSGYAEFQVDISKIKAAEDRMTIVVPGADFSIHPIIEEYQGITPPDLVQINWYYAKGLWSGGYQP